MAYEWIKVETTIFEKPEVLEMATLLNLSVDEVVAKLIQVWIWFDTQTKDGHASVTLMSYINSKVSVKNFSEAMKKVGWLTEKDGNITIPKWDRHNSKSAKARSLASLRKKRERSRKCHDGNVTKTGLEKRKEKREYINNIKEKNIIKKENEILQTGEKNSGLTNEKNRRIKLNFDEFWKIYPKKTGKKNAQKSYQRINPDENLHAEILRSVKNHNSLRWQFTDKQFIPDPATWLNQERWTDEVIPAAQERKPLSAVDQVAAYNKQAEARRAQQSEIDITNVASEVHNDTTH